MRGIDFGFSGVFLWKVRECRMNCGFLRGKMTRKRQAYGPRRLRASGIWEGNRGEMWEKECPVAAVLGLL
jgi:hypothetical protein